MGQIHLKRTFNYPADQVWKWLKDYGNIHRIHPMIGHSYIEGEQSCGIGAVRVCEMNMGGFQLKERVLDWQENQSYTVDIYETTMPLMKRSLATFGVRAIGAETSEVYIDIEYTTSWGIFGKLMDVLFMNPVMTMMMKRMFRKLDEFLSSSRQESLRAPG
ncbi:SRPBCC family protein [Methylobacter sp. YRD-M1]|uniref:SRPBCC family protein n=1 Tax=Methylobacter sp. YRD-M1 TaxID=2911520 RepID=UPI00227ABDA7|nr:SRPBCC family protein [Methylobacter sp. YRD-M1]WAK01021.1 SRPBCC family protein [Methylobacter sp. YRD-M1]